MDLNDVPATANRFLLTETLRDQWHFRGFVVSDADAVKSLQAHGLAGDQVDAAGRALNAGINMEMALDNPAFDHLERALQSDAISIALIDKAVMPILETKIQLGLFEHPYVDVEKSRAVLSDPAAKAQARQAAVRSVVLLKNDGHLLPLTTNSYKRIAIIGPTGESPADLTGSWTFVQDNADTVTLEQGLSEKLGSSASVSYAPGVQISRLYPSFFDAIFHTQHPAAWTSEEARSQYQKAINLARSSDLILLTMGESQDMTGEAASRSSLELPGEQLRLMQEIVAIGRPTILILQSGRPLDLTWAVQHVPSILEVWYPGTEGGAAIADLLFGAQSPGGHLPFSWPRNVGQIPINYSHNLTQDSSKQGERYWNEASTPLFPFGFGLTYSSFTFSNLTVDEPNSLIGQNIHVRVNVSNTGSSPADEVVQLYIHQRSGRSSRPVRELKGFQRVSLGPGTHQTISFALGANELSYWSASDRKWGEDAADFDLWAGADSTATLHAKFTRQAAASKH